MSDTFITSDQHYGHEFIRKVKNRPFRDIYEMQEEMIARHNKKVPDSKNFLTIHAGDLFWRTLDPDECMGILNRLHGRHALVWGNHDDVIQESKWLSDAFEWTRDIHQLYFNKHRLTICHYAMRVWPKSHQGHWHVYGHSHQELPPQGLSFDIGVEGHNYEPWSLEEIESKMQKLAPYVTPHYATKGKEPVATQPANIQTYVDEWVKVAADGNVVVDYAWNPEVNRMQLRCTECDQILTCAIPEVPEKIDYALQKFVGLHRHAAFVPPTATSINVETNKWGYVPISTKKINRATLIDEEGRRFRE